MIDQISPAALHRHTADLIWRFDYNRAVRLFRSEYAFKFEFFVQESDYLG